MEKHLVSIIIPIYNTADYIERCITSITDNTYKNLEIICINDGSTDSSIEVLERISKKDPRIKVISNKNQGVSATRNLGIELATGDYISFVDSDDWIHPQFVETLINVQIKYNADVVNCNLFETSEQSKNVDLSNDYVCQRVANIFEMRTIKYVCGKLYKSEIIKKYRFPVGIKIAEDTFFNVYVYANELDNGNKMEIYQINIVLYYYYQRANSTLKIIPHYVSSYELAEKYLNLSANAKTEEVKLLCVERAFKSSFLYRYLQMFSDNYPSIKKEVRVFDEKCMNILKALELCSIKTYLFYDALTKIPFIYRAMRIAGDRTMLIWEKEQKELKRQRKKNEKQNKSCS